MTSFLAEIKNLARMHIKEKQGAVKSFKGRHRVPRFVIRRLRDQKAVLKARILDAIENINTRKELLEIEGLCNLFFTDQKPEKIEKALKAQKQKFQKNHC